MTVVSKKIDSTVYDFLDKKYSNTTEIISVKRKLLYSVIPYIGHLSVKTKIEMYKLISENYPHIDPQLF